MRERLDAQLTLAFAKSTGWACRCIICLCPLACRRLRAPRRPLTDRRSDGQCYRLYLEGGVRDRRKRTTPARPERERAGGVEAARSPPEGKGLAPAGPIAA